MTLETYGAIDERVEISPLWLKIVNIENAFHLWKLRITKVKSGAKMVAHNLVLEC